MVLIIIINLIILIIFIFCVHHFIIIIIIIYLLAPNGETSFSDGYPFLIASINSLNAINEKLEKKITIERFRPNIIVGNCESFAEDKWEKIQFESQNNNNNNIIMSVVKPCSRCKVIIIIIIIIIIIQINNLQL
jgi:hypothetical protein